MSIPIISRLSARRATEAATLFNVADRAHSQHPVLRRLTAATSRIADAITAANDGRVPF
ncbi:MAG: hypothetical protein M3186_12870 [Actinomycetota bacterium]|nr:hypothetical protein [Actinomycetota bacterium]